MGPMKERMGPKVDETEKERGRREKGEKEGREKREVEEKKSVQKENRGKIDCIFHLASKGLL